MIDELIAWRFGEVISSAFLTTQAQAFAAACFTNLGDSGEAPSSAKKIALSISGAITNKYSRCVLCYAPEGVTPSLNDCLAKISAFFAQESQSYGLAIKGLAVLLDKVGGDLSIEQITKYNDTPQGGSEEGTYLDHLTNYGVVTTESEPATAEERIANLMRARDNIIDRIVNEFGEAFGLAKELDSWQED